MAPHRHPLPIEQVPDWHNRLLRGATTMGVPLDQRALDRFEAFARMLQTWGSRLNLSSRLDADELIPLHFLDSLALPAVTPLPEGDSLLDLGSGAGIPGIPLAIARSDLHVTLLEPRVRRAVFLREVVHRLELGQVAVVQERAEALANDPSPVGGHNWMTARAVSPLADVLTLAVPLMPEGGRLVVFLGPDDEPGGTPWFTLERVPSMPVPGKTAPRSLAIFRRTGRPHKG